MINDELRREIEQIADERAAAIVLAVVRQLRSILRGDDTMDALDILELVGDKASGNRNGND